MTSGERPKGSIFYRRTTRLTEAQVSRRSFFVGAASALIGAGVLYKSGQFDRIAGWFEEKPTDEQKEAAKLLAGDKNIFENIISLEAQDDEGNIIPIRLRNKPGVPLDENDNGGEVIGELKAGVRIDKAVAFEGNDPFFPYDRERKSIWYAFYLPNDPDTVYFAWMGYFSPLIVDRLIGKVDSFE